MQNIKGCIVSPKSFAKLKIRENIGEMRTRGKVKTQRFIHGMVDRQLHANIMNIESNATIVCKNRRGREQKGITLTRHSAVVCSSKSVT